MVERFLQRYSLLMNARNHTSKPREGAQPMQGLRPTLSTFRRVLLFLASRRRCFHARPSLQRVLEGLPPARFHTTLRLAER